LDRLLAIFLRFAIVGPLSPYLDKRRIQVHRFDMELRFVFHFGIDSTGAEKIHFLNSLSEAKSERK
jgi:hypothetical protein